MKGASRWSSRVVRESGGVGAKLWPEILALSQEDGVINLGQGFPDFAGSAPARAGAAEALEAPKYNQYSPINGLPSLTEAVADLYAHMYPSSPRLNPSKEVCILCSTTSSIFCASLAFLNEGDEAIVFEPMFPWYLPSIRMAGGVPVVVKLEPPNFALDPAELAKAVTPKTKFVMINTPHNPTGHVLSAAELEAVAKICVEHDLLCISDEVYEVVTFSGAAHMRISDFPGMAPRTLTFGGASKMLSLTGWRIGWVTGPEELVGAVRAVHSYSNYSAPTPLQVGCASALQEAVRERNFTFGEVAAKFERNWKVLRDALQDTGVEVCDAQGGYFLVADVTASGKTDMEYCKWLAKERKVAAVPMSMFYSLNDDGTPQTTHLVRFAICKAESYIDSAASRIRGE